MSTDVDDFIAHFGTKGMKWGVRKARDDVPNTFKSKEQLDKEAHNRQIVKNIAIGAAVVAALGISVYAGKQAYNYNKEASILSKRAKQGFSGEILKRYGKDSAKTFERGHEFLRSSEHAETGMNLRTFAVASKRNAASYETFGDWKLKITALKDVNTPSTKQRVDLLAAQVSKKDLQMRAAAKDNLGAKIAARYPNKKQLGAIKLDKITMDEWKGEEAKSFINTLKSKGFSAVWDDYDNTSFSGSSYILFDEKAFKYSAPVLAR